jgi:hypothetical protein
MARFARIDTSLPQRSDLLRLFQTLERENLSPEEMERIADAVEKAGNSALPPLLRRLRKATSSSVIARYLYLLDFFEDDSWLDELVRITLKRKDLKADAKTVLLAGLERSGIDIEELPFSRLLHEVDSTSSAGLNARLAKGESGFVSFMEEFVGYSTEAQVAVIRILATMNTSAADSLLEILLGYSDGEIVTETIISLGRIRRQSAATVLERYVHYGDRAFRVLAERSLKRLSFLGIRPSSEEFPLSDRAVHLTAASTIEGSGFRSLWFSRWNGSGGLDVLILQTHESCGITDAAGYAGLTPAGHDELFREAVAEESLLEVTPDYAHLLLRDALYLNADKDFPIPPEFYVWRRILQYGEMSPEPLQPDFSSFNLADIAESTELFEAGDTLLDENCFSGWFPTSGKVFDLAEELAELQDRDGFGLSENHLALLLKKFMWEVITPEKNRIIRRLYLIADLMLRTGSDRELIERILAAALHLAKEDVPYLKNPFLRRFALDSLSFARDAMEQGYDPRQIEREWGDEELWD